MRRYSVVALVLIRTFAAQRRKREETEASNSIVHGDKDDTLLGELNAGRVGRGARTARETAAVDPDHHRQIASGRISRTPDVQIQAILGRPLGRRRARARSRARRRPASSLHTAPAEFRGLSHSRPPRRRLWWTPPQLTDRGRREGNALEGDHAIGLDSLQLTAVNSHDRGHLLWLALVGFLCAC